MKPYNKFLLLFLLFLSGEQLFANLTADTVTIVKINVLVGLQFDQVRFHVKPGEKVKLIFSNSDDMSHNFLITKPGSRLEIVNEALQLGEMGPSMDYIPKSASILWSIPLVNPNQTKEFQ